MNSKWILTLLIGAACLPSALHADDHDLNIKFDGDVRYRVQADKNESDSVARLRNRVRYRLGATSKVNDSATVYAGLASGGTDPRSTNQTLGSEFQTPGIQLDYAYIKHQVKPNLNVLLGKMKNPLVRFNDLLWDTDIRPEGVALQYNRMLKGKKWYVNAAYFVLDEEKTANEPALLVIQEGIEAKIKDIDIKTALSVYRTLYVAGHMFEAENSTGNLYSGGTNTGATTGLTNEFNTVSIAMKVGKADVAGLEYVGVFGEVATNSEMDSSNQAGIVGVAFGDKKVKGKGKWQTKVNYRYIGKDAFLDITPDSDAYGGDTGVQGTEVAFSYGLSKMSKLGLDIYSMDKIEDASSDTELLVQLDYSLKF